MPITTLSGAFRSGYYPFDLRAMRPTVINQLTIGSPNEKVAMGGRVWFQEGPSETKEIVRIGLLLGTVVKAGGTQWLVSLYDMEQTASADQPHPDFIDDQNVVVTAAEISSNTWLRTGALSTNRAVSFGDPLCVVVAVNGSLSGSDSLGIAVKEAPFFMRTPWVSHFGGFTWSLSTGNWPIVVLEFDDGSFGTLDGCYVTAGPSEHLFTNATSPDEYGVQFTVPWSCSVDALCCLGGLATSLVTFDLVLYQGTTELASVAMHGGHVGADSQMTINGTLTDFEPGWILGTLGSEQTIGGGTSVIVAVRNTSASQFRLNYETLGDAGHGDLWGENVEQVSRTNGGSWSTDASKVPLLGLRVSALQDA